MENPDNRAFIIGSLRRLTGSVTTLTIEIITGSRDDLIVTTKINVFVFGFFFTPLVGFGHSGPEKELVW